MKEKIVRQLGEKFDDLNIFIDDVFIQELGGEKVLTVVLDSEEMIDLKTVVKATRILNPIIDALDFIEDTYTLDVYAKEKGENYEQ